MAVTLAIYATGSISGTHANPAVTLTLALFRGFPWKKVVPYWIAQVVGGFLGAVIVYALFFPVIDHFNAAHHLTRPDSIQTAGVFFTHPGLAITPLHALSDQIILTAFLLFGIFAITEQYNEMAPGANFGAVMIGLLVAIIGACMGLSRSLGDRTWSTGPPAGTRRSRSNARLWCKGRRRGPARRVSFSALGRYSRHRTD